MAAVELWAGPGPAGQCGRDFSVEGAGHGAAGPEDVASDGDSVECKISNPNWSWTELTCADLCRGCGQQLVSFGRRDAGILAEHDVCADGGMFNRSSDHAFF